MLRGKFLVECIHDVMAIFSLHKKISFLLRSSSFCTTLYWEPKGHKYGTKSMELYTLLVYQTVLSIWDDKGPIPLITARQFYMDCLSISVILCLWHTQIHVTVLRTMWNCQRWAVFLAVLDVHIDYPKTRIKRRKLVFTISELHLHSSLYNFNWTLRVWILRVNTCAK